MSGLEDEDDGSQEQQTLREYDTEACEQVLESFLEAVEKAVGSDGRAKLEEWWESGPRTYDVTRISNVSRRTWITTTWKRLQAILTCLLYEPVVSSPVLTVDQAPTSMPLMTIFVDRQVLPSSLEISTVESNWATLEDLRLTYFSESKSHKDAKEKVERDQASEAIVSIAALGVAESATTQCRAQSGLSGLESSATNF